MRASLVLLAAMVSVAYAVGQYYVPRSYYTIDSDGHETAPVPLRRLRRSADIFRQKSGASANANTDHEARDNANANAYPYAKGVPMGLSSIIGASRGSGVGTSRETGPSYIETRVPIPGSRVH